MIRKISLLILVFAVSAAAVIWADDTPDLRRGRQGERQGHGFYMSGSDEDGLLISGIVEDSPAEKAGIIRGDILTAIGGTEVNSVAEINGVLSDYKAGQKISIDVLRGGEKKSITLILEDRINRPVLGIEFTAPGMRFERAFMIGVLIAEVIEGSPADKAGLVDGDIIVEVNEEPVDPFSFAETILTYKAGDTLELKIFKEDQDPDTEPVEITAKLGETDDGNPLLGVRFSPMPGFPGFMDQMRRGFDRFERKDGDDDDPEVYRRFFRSNSGDDA